MVNISKKYLVVPVSEEYIVVYGIQRLASGPRYSKDN